MSGPSYSYPTGQSNFRVVVANCDGAQGKQASIEEMCDYMHPDALLFCETKTDPDPIVKTQNFIPKQHRKNCFRNDRDRHGGGVCVAIHDDYIVEEIEFPGNDCEVQWVKVILQNNDPMYIASYYRTPSDHTTASLDKLEKTLEHIGKLLDKNPRITVIIGGDFNTGGEIDWETLKVKPGGRNTKICQKIIDLFTAYGLTQMQREPTRFGNILDLYATNKPGLVKSIKNAPGLAYDHDSLVIDMDIKARVSKKAPYKQYI